MTEHDAQPGHQRLQRVGRVRRAVIGPEPLDQRAGGDHPARVQGEQDQQRPHPLTAHVDRPARGIGDLKRAEHTHPNRVRRRDHVAFPAQRQTAPLPPPPC